MNGRIIDTDADVFAIETGETDEFGQPLYKIARANELSEKVKRDIVCLLRTFEGECFVDYEAGFPWFDSALGNSVLFSDEISSEIKDKILSVEGVKEVKDIVVNVDGRNVSGKYKVVLEDDTIVQGDI